MNLSKFFLNNCLKSNFYMINRLKTVCKREGSSALFSMPSGEKLAHAKKTIHKSWVFFIRLSFAFMAFAASLSGQVAAANHGARAFRNFWHPTFVGQRLAYCTLDGRACGKAVADRYCQILGYDYSTQNKIAYNLGLTHFIDTRAQCKGWSCNGFMTIACAVGLSHNPPKPYHYREKRFTTPRYHGYRIDWCYEQNKGCGQKAAHSFCSRMGYIQAKRFIKETKVGATRTIGSEQLCFGNECNAFQMIICYR